MANGHYDVGGISVIDIIRAKLTEEQYKGFLLGNIIKYSTRLNWKGESQKDADKLSEYSMWLGKAFEQYKHPCSGCKHAYKSIDAYPCCVCKRAPSRIDNWEFEDNSSYKYPGENHRCQTCRFRGTPLRSMPCVECYVGNEFRSDYYKSKETEKK